MFDGIDEEIDRKRAEKLKNSTMPKTETPSKLYTKKFTKAEWEKLDVVLEIGESKTVQDLMQERYNIEFVEEKSCAAKNPVIEYQY